MSRGWSLLLIGGLAWQARPAEAQFPKIVYAGEQPLPVQAVPLNEARGELRAGYRVKLDRRLVGAVGEIHRLASGRPAGTVLATLGPRGWVLQHEADTVGTVAELPGFRDGERVLSAWAARVLRRYPLPSRASADADAGDLSLPVVAHRLQTVDGQWATRRHAALLGLGARGLTLLAFQLPRQSEVADPLSARAIAAVLLAAAAGQDVAAERVLLAHHFGYTAEAAALALALPSDHPVRHFAAGDTLRLRRAAEQADARPLIRYLYLLKLADTGTPALWRSWQRRQRVEPDFHSGVLGAAMDFTSSEVDQSLPELVPQQLWLEAARLDDVAVTVAGTDSAAAWHLLLAPRLAGDRSAMLARFEADVQRLAQRFRGPFLDGPALALYFRAQLHAAFERRCIHGAGASGSRTTAGAFAQPPEGLWATTVRWCRHRGRVMGGEDPVQALLSDVAVPPSTLSDEALDGTLDDLDERIAYGDSTDVLAARRYFQRLDSRPSHVYRAGIIAENLLYDVPLKERFYGRLLELAPADHSYLRAWWARYWENTGTLRAMARDPAFRREDRLFAIRALQNAGGDSAGARAAFAKLIAEDPDDWDLRRDFIELLEASHRYEYAARVAREWLATHRSSSFDWTTATTALARQLHRLGRPQEGWQLLAPLIRRNNQLGPFQRSALIAKDLGEMAKAESLATAIVTRYPDSPHSRITLAEVLWAQRRYQEVPAVLNDPRHALSVAEWRDPVAPAFVRVFGRGSVEPARAAFGALLAAGIPRGKLEAIPEAASDSGRYELAATLHEQLPMPAGRSDQIEAWVETYQHWRRWKGEAGAVDWLRKRWAGPASVGASVVFYREQEFDLLWTVTTQPDQGADGSYLWVLRALAAVQQPLSPDRRAQLMAHFQAPSNRFYDIAGRYLLGLEPEGALLARANDPHRRCEASYYAGVRALAQRRYADASDWFRVTVETPGTEDWEWLYAKDLIYRWSNEHRALPIAVRKVAARR